MSKKRKERDDFPGNLFPFQRSIVEKAISKRCAAIFADTGLGKTRMLLCWLEVILRGQPGAMGLIVTPLSTGRQLVDEALGMGLNAIVEKRAMMPRDSDLDDPKYEGRALIAVTNYERLKNFELSKFFAVALDESGVLKDAGSVTASLLVSGCAAVPYRLSLRAPPSPDDLDELINQAVFLGYGTRESIVSKHINAAGRRFSLIDEQAFFEFVCEWSCWIRKPSDIGFDSDDARYELPGIDYTSVVVPSPGKNTKPGKRAAQRDGLASRIKAVCDLTDESDSPTIVWCLGNDESAQLARRIEGAVELCGDYSVHKKEAILTAFTEGSPYNGAPIKVLVSKTSICGLGVNLQRVHRQIFSTITENATTFYQSVRRSHRFGQTQRVAVYVVASEAEGDVLKALQAKQEVLESSWVKLTALARSSWGA